jgi:hypothetical protein
MEKLFTEINKRNVHYGSQVGKNGQIDHAFSA